MPPPYLFHPIAVHFPIALLTLGMALALIHQFWKKEGLEWIGRASLWLLWIGTLSAAAAVGLGLLAEETVPHVPAAWEVVEEHEELAFWTLGLFAALSLIRILLRKKWDGLETKWKILFLAGWGVALGVLLATAQHGGELVYEYGVGFLK
ncbi:MAG: hypothetical protein A3A86_08415 [Elusimicrobia bacterium RIFCSPLOWO2_01_FULL_60_11]|nr:MAG: hypothetical protein A3A86_08415 [Elusimicrobia bacterium RIFCSPLOWO2_01_FULL_60_11]